MRADSVLPVMEAGQAELVRDDYALDDHVRLAPTSGHTPHHVGVCLGRDGDDAVMPGDVLHSPLQARYPELSPRFNVDKEYPSGEGRLAEARRAAVVP